MQIALVIAKEPICLMRYMVWRHTKDAKMRVSYLLLKQHSNNSQETTWQEVHL